MAKRRESEKGAMSKWLRNGQVGGSAALAKEMNRDVPYVEGRLRGFETTRGVNRWVGSAGPTRLTASGDGSGTAFDISRASSGGGDIALRATRAVAAGGGGGGYDPRLPGAKAPHGAPVGR
jgi:hypothetical protein